MSLVIHNDPVDFGITWSGTTTAKSAGVKCDRFNFVHLAFIVASTGTIKVEVANNDTDAEYVTHTQLTATGKVEINPAWRYFRVNVTANGSGITGNWVGGELRH